MYDKKSQLTFIFAEMGFDGITSCHIAQLHVRTSSAWWWNTIFPAIGAEEHPKINRTPQFCWTMDRYNLREADGRGLQEGGTERKQRPFSFPRKIWTWKRSWVIKTSLKEKNTKWSPFGLNRWQVHQGKN